MSKVSRQRSLTLSGGSRKKKERKPLDIDQTFAVENLYNNKSKEAEQKEEEQKIKEQTEKKDKKTTYTKGIKKEE